MRDKHVHVTHNYGDINMTETLAIITVCMLIVILLLVAEAKWYNTKVHSLLMQIADTQQDILKREGVLERKIQGLKDTVKNNDNSQG